MTYWTARGLCLVLPLVGGCAMFQPKCSVPVGAWVAPATGMVITDPLPGAAGRAAVVLLGETHDSAPDHRWQFESISALYYANTYMVLGFEMFPRSVQPLLDKWVKGEYPTEQAFLDAVDWKKIWNVEPALYMPIFKFARDHQIPMMALNVPRALVSRVGKEGWAAIQPKDREGVGDPAPALPAYRDRLAEVMGGHTKMKDAQIDRFVEAQLVWDRAMAERIAKARGGRRPPMVVAIMGAGHIANGDGVAHQLAALEVEAVASYLPWSADDGYECSDLKPGLADAVFGTPPEPKAKAKAKAKAKK